MARIRITAAEFVFEAEKHYPFKKDFLFNTCRTLPEIQFREQGS